MIVELVNVSSLKPIRWMNVSLHALVLPASFIPSLEGRAELPYPDGCNVLMKGPSGIGKTSTAIKIAEHVRRPLLRLNDAELGTTSAGVYSLLTEALYLSRRWKCILLLDDLDKCWTDLMEEEINKDWRDRLKLLNDYEYPGLSLLTANRDTDWTTIVSGHLNLILRFDPFDKETALKVWRIKLQQTFVEHQNVIIDG